jgi:hypothetical protein
MYINISRFLYPPKSATEPGYTEHFIIPPEPNAAWMRKLMQGLPLTSHPKPLKSPRKKITVILFWHCWTYRGNARHNKDETDLPRPVIELECEL